MLATLRSMTRENYPALLPVLICITHCTKRGPNVSSPSVSPARLFLLFRLVSVWESDLVTNTLFKTQGVWLLDNIEGSECAQNLLLFSFRAIFIAKVAWRVAMLHCAPPPKLVRVCHYHQKTFLRATFVSFCFLRCLLEQCGRRVKAWQLFQCVVFSIVALLMFAASLVSGKRKTRLFVCHLNI